MKKIGRNLILVLGLLDSAFAALYYSPQGSGLSVDRTPMIQEQPGNSFSAPGGGASAAITQPQFMARYQLHAT